MNDKMDVLLMIAKKFNALGITWNVGASCMLYLRGIVDHFHDIDLMIALEDVEQVKALLSTYSRVERKKNDDFRTRVFLEYIINGVELDIMAGFSIVSDQKEYYFPLTKEQIIDEVDLDGTPIYLEKVETWHRYYELMKRDDKVKIIDTYTMKKFE